MTWKDSNHSSPLIDTLDLSWQHLLNQAIKYHIFTEKLKKSDLAVGHVPSLFFCTYLISDVHSRTGQTMKKVGRRHARVFFVEREEAGVIETKQSI